MMSTEDNKTKVAFAFAALVICLPLKTSQAQDWRRATQLPGVDMSGLGQRQQMMVLKILREEECPCGCLMKLAQCRVEDESCPVSPTLVQRVTDAARQGHSSMVIRAALVTEQSPDQIRREIRFESIQAAALANELPPVAFAPPAGTERVYRYDFGPYSDDGPVPRRKIPQYDRFISYPIELQRTVEAIRKGRSKRFWGAYLSQVENVVRQQVTVLNRRANRGDNELHQQLRTLSNRGYQILDGAIERYARSQGWSAQLSVMHGEAIAPPGYVKVAINPQGASVYYSSEAKFRETAALGIRAIRNVKDNWQALGRVNNERSFGIPVSGRIRFYAVWPNGLEEISVADVEGSFNQERIVTPVSLRAF